MRQLVLLGVCVLDIADRTRDLADVGSDACVALAADARLPVDGLADTDLGGELVVGETQVVGEGRRGARRIRTVNQGDRRCRQGHARVDRSDLGVVPGGDGATEDVTEHLAVHGELARGDTRHIHNGHNATDNGGELEELLVSQLGAHRVIRSTEIDGLGDDLLLATTRADGLVVQLIAGCCLVGFGPLGVHRCRKGCASTSNFSGLCGQGRQSHHGASKNRELVKTHGETPEVTSLKDAPW